MVLLSDLNLSLPLKNPVVIFSLVLFIILFAPIIFNRLKIPHIIGLIISGIIIGPFGLNLLLRDSSMVLFGTVGLLYIMFTAGLEIDLEEFRKNQFKSLVFGLFTFIFPMLLGTFTAFYFLQYSLPSSLLLASMFASHTLLAYPIARTNMYCEILSSNFLKNHLATTGNKKNIMDPKMSVAITSFVQNVEPISPLVIPVTVARTRRARISVMMVPPIVNVTDLMRAIPYLLAIG